MCITSVKLINLFYVTNVLSFFSLLPDKHNGLYLILSCRSNQIANLGGRHRGETCFHSKLHRAGIKDLNYERKCEIELRH